MMIEKKLKIKNSKLKIERANRPGVALLVVLFIVMAVTILSFGFISRSDVELACGQNMVLRANVDYLAQSGLEHAKGLILNPQDIDAEYWSGDVRQQLSSGSDYYYDVNVVQIDKCDYQITSVGYREKGSEQLGRSTLTARLRLDPVIALWVGRGSSLGGDITVNGDVNCSGSLINFGVLNGDVFAGNFDGNSPAGSISLRTSGSTLSRPGPGLTEVEGFTSHYATQSVSGSLSGPFGPYSPVRVFYSTGDLELAGNVTIDGMLLVDGDLTVNGSGNVLRAGKNVPAVYVTGDCFVKEGALVSLEGLVIVDGDMKISSASSNVTIVGGLFVGGEFSEVTFDSSGYNRDASLYGDPAWQSGGGYTAGAADFDGIDDRIEDSGADSYLNGLSAVTVSVWVKSDVTDQDRGMFFTRNPTDRDEELGMRYDKDGAFGGGVKVIKASLRTNMGFTQIESSSNIQTTNWQHLALVWQSGSSVQLYVNGQPNVLTYDKGPVSGSITGVDKLMFGLDSKGKYWDGRMDDVRIYNRALTDPNEIYLPVDGLAGEIAHWRFDDSGSNIDITAWPSKTAIKYWTATSDERKWSQAAGAFFRSIARN